MGILCLNFFIQCSSSNKKEDDSSSKDSVNTREMTIPTKDECTSGNCDSEKSLYRWKNGDVFNGQFNQGKRNGQGSYTWASGSNYTGEWKDGKRHGKGTYLYANGDKYVGSFENDKRHGTGIYTYKNGESIPSQQWDNGRPVR